MMKGKCICLYPVLVLFLFCISCGEKVSEGDGVIDVASSLSLPKELKASDYFKKVRYVPLETTDSCLIGRGAVVRFLGDKIVVTTNQKQCFLFDKETGRFIASVGHMGNDPEGYKSVNCWLNHLNNTLYFEGWSNNWVCYDDRGKYAGKVSYPITAGSVVRASTYLDDDTYITQVSDMFSSQPDSLFIHTQTEIQNHYTLLPADNQTFDVNAIQSISVIGSGESVINTYGAEPTAGVMTIDYMEADKGNLLIMGNYCLWHTRTDLYYKTLYNDTIFQVKDRQLSPYLVFESGNYHWPYEDRFNKKRNDALLITHIMDGQDNLLFRFVVNPFGEGDKRKVYNGFYNKKTGKVEVDFLDKGITDDFGGFLAFQPQTISPSGEYAGLISASDIVERWEDDIPVLSDEVQKLRGVEEEDNPVVYILE